MVDVAEEVVEEEEALAVVEGEEEAGEPGHGRPGEQPAVEEQEQYDRQQMPGQGVEVHEARALRPGAVVEGVAPAGEGPPEGKAQCRQRPPGPDTLGNDGGEPLLIAVDKGEELRGRAVQAGKLGVMGECGAMDVIVDQPAAVDAEGQEQGGQRRDPPQDMPRREGLLQRVDRASCQHLFWFTAFGRVPLAGNVRSRCSYEPSSSTIGSPIAWRQRSSSARVRGARSPVGSSRPPGRR